MGRVQTGVKVPNFAVQAALKMVRNTVRRKAQLDVDDLKPIANVDKCVRSGWGVVCMRVCVCVCVCVWRVCAGTH